MCVFVCLASKRASGKLYTGDKLRIMDIYFLVIYIYIYLCVCVCVYVRTCHFVLDPRFCVSSVANPVPNFTKQNPLVYQSLPISPKEIELFTALNSFFSTVKTYQLTS